MIIRKMKKIVSSLVVVVITLLGLFFISDLLEDKTGRNTYQTFQEVGEDIDVLYLGSSHIRQDIFPIEMWNDYGIAGYTVGYSAYRIPMNYWVLKEALLYSEPKLVVVDVYLLSEVALAGNEEVLHTFFDGFPLSKTKIDAVRDLNYTLEGKTNQLDLLFNFSRYHNRWNDIEQADFKSSRNVARGAIRYAEINHKEFQNELIPMDVITENYNISMEYLEKIIQLAKEEGIEILLVSLPQPSTVEAQAYYNYCYKLAEKYEINYLDMSRVEGLVNYRVDLVDFNSAEEREEIYRRDNQYLEESVYDNNGHLNVSGANKVSVYLGKYIMDNYDITDRRGEEGYEYWDSDYEIWLSQNIISLKTQDDLSEYLLELADNNYDFVIEINDTDIFKDELYLELFNNFGISSPDLNSDTDFVVVRRGGEAASVHEKFHENGSIVESPLGQFSLWIDETGEYHDGEKGHYGIYLNNEEFYLGVLDESVGMRITVMKAGTLDVVDEVSFVYEVSNEEDYALDIKQIVR